MSWLHVALWSYQEYLKVMSSNPENWMKRVDWVGIAKDKGGMCLGCELCREWGVQRRGKEKKTFRFASRIWDV